MRPLRNSMNTFAILLIYGLLAFQVCNTGQSSAQESIASQVLNPYFPLAVGNSWTYRCSVEGQFQFTKTIRIVSTDVIDEHKVYRAEMRTGKDPKPLISYLTIEPNGQVATFLESETDALEVLITATPEVGDKIGQFTVAAKECSTEKTLPSTDIIRLENFSIDNPEIPETKRLEWRSRTYGRGIGLVEEADGLGGACTLSKFTHQNAK